MVEITYRTARESCRECYAVGCGSNSPLSPNETEERRRGQIRTQANLEVLTNGGNHTTMDMLKDLCTACKFSRPRVMDMLSSGVLSTLEAADKKQE